MVLLLHQHNHLLAPQMVKLKFEIERKDVRIERIDCQKNCVSMDTYFIGLQLLFGDCGLVGKESMEIMVGELSRWAVKSSVGVEVSNPLMRLAGSLGHPAGRNVEKIQSRTIIDHEVVDLRRNRGGRQRARWA